MTRTVGFFLAFPISIGVFALGGHFTTKYIGAVDQLLDSSSWIILFFYIVIGLVLCQYFHSYVVALLMKINDEPNDPYMSGVSITEWGGRIIWSRPSEARAGVYLNFSFLILSTFWLVHSTGKLQLVDDSWLQTIFVSSTWTVEAHKLVDSAPNYASEQTVQPVQASTPQQNVPESSALGTSSTALMKVNTIRLNVHTGPSKEYPLISPFENDTFRQGDTVRVLSVTPEHWCEVIGTNALGLTLHGYVNCRKLSN